METITPLPQNWLHGMDCVLRLNTTNTEMNILSETTDFGKFVQMQKQKWETDEAQVQISLCWPSNRNTIFPPRP